MRCFSGNPAIASSSHGRKSRQTSPSEGADRLGNGGASLALASPRGPRPRLQGRPRRDPVQPGPERPWPLEGSGLAGQDEERGLKAILGGVGVGQHAAADAQDERSVSADQGRECRLLGDGELTYTPPTVEQDAELAPAVSVPVAIPVSEDELPVAGLAPVLALPYYPEPKVKRKTRKPKVMRAAVEKAEPLFVKRGRRYAEAGPPTGKGEKLYRRVSQGKRVRYQAA
jgi:hypothetical protein